MSDKKSIKEGYQPSKGYQPTPPPTPPKEPQKPSGGPPPSTSQGDTADKPLPPKSE